MVPKKVGRGGSSSLERRCLCGFREEVDTRVGVFGIIRRFQTSLDRFGRFFSTDESVSPQQEVRLKSFFPLNNKAFFTLFFPRILCLGFNICEDFFFWWGASLGERPPNTEKKKKEGG